MKHGETVSHPDDPAFLQAKAKIGGIFFDLDGTLMDTDDAFLDSLASRLGRLGRLFAEGDPRPLLRRAMLAAEGPVNHVVTLLDAVGLDDNLFSIGNRLRRVRGLRVQGQFTLIEGAVETIHSLHGSYRLGIITTRSREDAWAFVRQFDLGGAFEVVSTREDTRRLKPHPQPIQYAADLVGLSPTECAMVGDTAVDIISAKAAGSYAVGVLCGFGEREDLTAAGADLILDHTAQLAAWF
jgi:HAD superfamily hydrolase (TIGR01549 family)